MVSHCFKLCYLFKKEGVKFLYLLIFLCCHLSGVAQDLSGTWEGIFHSDRLGKRSEFFLRIYLEQEDDFVWGVCEAMSVEKNRIRNIADFSEDELRCRYPVTGFVPVILEKNSLVSINAQNAPLFFMSPGFCETISSFLLYYDVEDSIAQLSGEWVSATGANPGVIGGANKVFIRRLSGKTPGFIEEFHPGREKKLRIDGKNEEEDKKKKEKKSKLPLFKKKVKDNTDTDGVGGSLVVKTDSSKAEDDTRLQDIQQYLELDTGVIQIAVYDNGVVDDDIISLFLNGEKIANKVKLSAKPLLLELRLDSIQENEFRLFAENVGSIPPNTAVMIIRAGAKRYEINLSASLQRDAIVILKIKK